MYVNRLLLTEVQLHSHAAYHLFIYRHMPASRNQSLPEMRLLSFAFGYHRRSLIRDQVLHQEVCEYTSKTSESNTAGKMPGSASS